MDGTMNGDDAALKRLVKRGQQLSREGSLADRAVPADGLGATMRRAYEGAARIREIAKKLRD